MRTICVKLLAIEGILGIDGTDRRMEIRLITLLVVKGETRVSFRASGRIADNEQSFAIALIDEKIR